jgi:subtilisin family serine protease
VNFSASHECPPEDDEATCLLRYRYVKEAIDKLTLTSSGAIKTLFVAAAPNESKNIDVNLDLPCRLNQTNPAIICVTRTGIVDNKEVFVDAGFGKNTVDLAAPGISIRTTDILNHYAVSSGTSLAAPQVTAAILMILQANPNLTLAQVKAILFNTVDTKNEVPSFGLAQNLDTPFHALEDKVRTKGRLNVDRAVRCAQDPELGCIYPLRKEQWNLEVIKAFDVHKQGIIGLDNHPEVFAGVIDSGVQADHPDLVANLHGNWAEYTGIGSDGNQIPNDVQGISLALNENGTLKNPYYKQQANGSAALPEYLKDDNGQPRCSGTSVPELAYQGTGVNGIIASAGQSYGLTGVNHRARILNINMFDVNSNGDCVASVPGLAQSLIYMAEVKAPVAQLSESVVCQDGIFPCEPSAVQLLKEAVCTFTHGDKYCEGKVERLLVVAMPDVNITSLAVFGPGILANRGYDYDFGDLSNLRTYPCHFARSERNPAGNEGIICVTSSRLNTTGPYSDNIERFEPDTAWWGRLTAALAAPGHRLLTTTLTGTGVPMSPTDNLLNYTYRTGTAYAAAHVTGAALLLMSASLDTTQPVGQQVTISPIQLKNLLLLTVDTKYHVPSFASAYWNFGNDQHWLLKALEDKVSTGGRLNLFRGWRCVQSHDCLSFASQMRSPIVFNSFAVQPVSSGKVKIFYMPPLTGEVHTDVNYYSNDVIYAVRDQLINNGLSTADVEIKWLEIPYNTPDEIMGNFTHGFSYFDTPGYINTGIVDSTGQIINQLQQSLEIGDKVVVIGSGLGADMLTDIFEQNPNLFMNPNMAALTLGAPFYESDSLANAEALSAATGSLWLNTNLNETFATQQLTGEHLQTIEQMAIRDQDFLDGFINNYDPADTQTEINQIVNHFSVN